MASPRPKRPLLGILLVLLGLAVGVPLGWTASVPFPIEGKEYILTRELDTAGAFPFKDAEPPLRARLQPGSEVRVVFRKGNVLYLRLHTVVSESELLRATTPSGE